MNPMYKYYQFNAFSRRGLLENAEAARTSGEPKGNLGPVVSSVRPFQLYEE
jgi:hypothetical protein